MVYSDVRRDSNYLLILPIYYLAQQVCCLLFMRLFSVFDTVERMVEREIIIYTEFRSICMVSTSYPLLSRSMRFK